MPSNFTYTVTADLDEDLTKRTYFEGVVWVMCALPYLGAVLYLFHWCDNSGLLLEYTIPNFVFYIVFLLLAVGGLAAWAATTFYVGKFLEKLKWPLFAALDVVQPLADGLQFEKRGLIKWDDMHELTEWYFHEEDQPTALFITLSEQRMLRVWFYSREKGNKPAPHREFAEEIYRLAPHLTPAELLAPAPWKITDEAIEIDSTSYPFRHIRSITVKEVLAEPPATGTGLQFHFSLRYWDETPPQPRTLPPLQGRALARNIRQVSEIPLEWEFYSWGD